MEVFGQGKFDYKRRRGWKKIKENLPIPQKIYEGILWFFFNVLSKESVPVTTSGYKVTMLQSSHTDLPVSKSLQFATYFFFLSQEGITHQMHKNHRKERSCNLCESRSEAIRGAEAPGTAQSSKDNPLQLQKHDICHLRAENVPLWLYTCKPVNPHSVQGTQTMYSHSSKYY